ncbi:hypothetical protein [Streptomyces montanisoli]|uniref:Uncharacterized protein n=1 Tax=Streptomyces montanisoli TaxID=2798581 RepID=A0A940M7I7_9ACTN|nr:hypothetical protein [Streptomyces montanisoli]MBP0456229.1 hypothetical protein [Streptomyces montanisoli]
MTPAAVAVIRATLEDATTAELISHPAHAAARVARALETAGWTLAPAEPANGPQTATHAIITNR